MRTCVVHTHAGASQSAGDEHREPELFPGESGAKDDGLPADANMTTLMELAESLGDRWQRVRRTNDRFYVFSAYLDARRVRMIRVIAAARTRLTDRVVCRIFTRGISDDLFQVVAGHAGIGCVHSVFFSHLGHQQP